MELLTVKNYTDRAQAHYLALAGIEKAKALLYLDARDRRRTNKNHTGQLYDDARDFREVRLGRGQFSVFHRAAQDAGGQVLYGVGDEESRLNLNNAAPDILTKLDGMTSDLAAAIIDWRDSDDVVSPGGAEKEYYASLSPPYLPRNGAFETIRELLMVRGVTTKLLFGDDVNQNGLLDMEEEAPDQDREADRDQGWAGVLTVDSTVRNVNAAGNVRVNVQTADETALTGVKGITSDIARPIMSYRNQNQFTSLADLLDVTAARGNGQNQGPVDPNAPKVISMDLLMDVADDLTTDSDDTQAGAININTAGLTVLTCLPGIDANLAHAIINYRQSEGFFPNTVSLLKVDGMTRDIFKPIAKLLTARSETFRILSEGRITSSGVRQRIQETVRLTATGIDTLSYREDL
jgi:competence ComEA-like helix-hairpin-helix protein